MAIPRTAAMRSLPIALVGFAVMAAGCVAAPVASDEFSLTLRTAYDESPYEREAGGTTHGHDRGRLPAGTVARDGYVWVMMRGDPVGVESAHMAPSLLQSAKAGGQGEPGCPASAQCYGLPALAEYNLEGEGDHRLPLGADGKVRIVLDRAARVALSMDGEVPEAPAECGRGFYQGETAPVQVEGPVEVVFPYVVRCA